MEIEISLEQAIALIRADRKCNRNQALAYIAGYLFVTADQNVVATMTKIKK
jgi:hypothetical protein